MSPTISVVVPVYNSELYLAQCIDSILAQTFCNFELLLINDGSTDASGRICVEYSEKDSRIKVFHKENGGVSSARNLGIDKAIGKYLCFIDSDDWVESSYFSSFFYKENTFGLDLLIQGYTKNFIEINYKETVTFSKNKEFKQDELFDVFIEGELKNINNSPCWKLFKTELVKLNKIYFDLNLSYGEDHLFTLEYYSVIKNISVSNSAVGYQYCRRKIDSLTSVYISDESLLYYSSKIYDYRLSLIKKYDIKDEGFKEFVSCQLNIYKLLMITSLFDNRCRYNNEIKKSKFNTYSSEYVMYKKECNLKYKFYFVLDMILKSKILPKYLAIGMLVKFKNLIKNN